MAGKVIIGCKSPSGFLLEVGYTIESGGRIIRSDRYQRIVLKGWNAHSEEMRRSGIQVPAGTNMRPFLNRGIDKDAWEEWKRLHPNSWLLKNKILFEATDEPSAASMVKDGEKTPTVLAPLNKDKPLPGITQADFTKPTKLTGTGE